MVRCLSPNRICVEVLSLICLPSLLAFGRTLAGQKSFDSSRQLRPRLCRLDGNVQLRCRVSNLSLASTVDSSLLAVGQQIVGRGGLFLRLVSDILSRFP